MITLKLEAFPVRFPRDIPKRRRGPFAGHVQEWVARDTERDLEGQGLTRREAIDDMRPAEERI